MARLHSPMSDESTKIPPIIAIVGKSGSGKTTFLEKLIPEFKRRGYRVGTIKHHHRRAADIDHEGKDSWRHTRAGADATVLASPERVALIKQLVVEMTPEEMRQQFFRDVDVVLAEGYKGSALPKIEIFRSDAHEAPVCLNDPMLVALVSDRQDQNHVACFGLDDVGLLTDFLEVRGFFA